MKIKTLLLTSLAALAAISSGQAQVIFNDTTGFANWYKGNTSAGTLTKGTDLVWTEGGNGGSEMIGRSFTETTLSAGETMTLSFDWTQSGGSVSIIRAGLYDIQNPITADGWAGTTNISGGTLGTYDGYTSFLRDNSTDGNFARVESGTNAGLTSVPTFGGTDIGTNTLQVDLSNNGSVTYNVVFSLTRVSSTQVDTVFSIFDGATSVLSVAGSQTTLTTFSTFNSAFIRSAGGTMTLDNISVAVIPEPSSVALLGLGLGAAIFLRRRRK